MHRPELVKLADLAQKFPSFQKMKSIPGIINDEGEFNGDALAANIGAWSSGETLTAKFLLHLWNRYDYTFDLSDIMRWDYQHGDVFAEWARNPFYG